MIPTGIHPQKTSAQRGREGLSQKWTKVDKEEGWSDSMWTSAFEVGLPTCDFVNPGRLHSLSQ